MRLLRAILMICSALAGRAAADPIDDRVDFTSQVGVGSPAGETNGASSIPLVSRARRARPILARSRGTATHCRRFLSALFRRRGTGRCFPHPAGLLSWLSQSPPHCHKSRRPSRLLPRNSRCLRWLGQSSAVRRASRCFKDPTPTQYPDSGLGKRMTAGGCKGSACAQSLSRRAHGR